MMNLIKTSMTFSHHCIVWIELNNILGAKNLILVQRSSNTGMLFLIWKIVAGRYVFLIQGGVAVGVRSPRGFRFKDDISVSIHG